MQMITKENKTYKCQSEVIWVQRAVGSPLSVVCVSLKFSAYNSYHLKEEFEDLFTNQ